MKGNGRFYELILGGLHKFEFVTFIFKKVGEEHPAVAVALAGGGSYALKSVSGHGWLALILAFALGAGAVLWMRHEASRRPKRGSRGGGRQRGSRKGAGGSSPRRTGVEPQRPGQGS